MLPYVALSTDWLFCLLNSRRASHTCVLRESVVSVPCLWTYSDLKKSWKSNLAAVSANKRNSGETNSKQKCAKIVPNQSCELIIYLVWASFSQSICYLSSPVNQAPCQMTADWDNVSSSINQEPICSPRINWLIINISKKLEVRKKITDFYSTCSLLFFHPFFSLRVRILSVLVRKTCRGIRPWIASCPWYPYILQELNRIYIPLLSTSWTDQHSFTHCDW